MINDELTFNKNNDKYIKYNVCKICMNLIEFNNLTLEGKTFYNETAICEKCYLEIKEACMKLYCFGDDKWIHN